MFAPWRCFRYDIPWQDGEDNWRTCSFCQVGVKRKFRSSLHIARNFQPVPQRTISYTNLYKIQNSHRPTDLHAMLGLTKWEALSHKHQFFHASSCTVCPSYQLKWPLCTELLSIPLSGSGIACLKILSLRII